MKWIHNSSTAYLECAEHEVTLLRFVCKLGLLKIKWNQTQYYVCEFRIYKTLFYYNLWLGLQEHGCNNSNAKLMYFQLQ